MYSNNTAKGTYELKNWDKYAGTKNPRYLSSYELKFFEWADSCSGVVRWAAESVIVKYFDPIKNKVRRYIVDIYMEVRTRTGEIKKYLIEIKPSQFTKAPKTSKRKRTTVIQEQATFATNQAKWQAAEQYAKERGWEFHIVTEADIFKF